MTLDSPSIRRAREAIPEGGIVLDVGCGAGAASVPLVPPAGTVIGLDSDEEVLAAFAELASRRGAEHTEIVGEWPDAAKRVPEADVVVCSHVVYNTAPVVPFAAALADHARRRTVVELTSEHPRAWQNPLWRELHDVERPTRPTSEDYVAVLREMGIEPHVERWMRQTPMHDSPLEDEVILIRVALCLTGDRDPDIARALRKHPPPSEREITTLWWDRG